MKRLILAIIVFFPIALFGQSFFDNFEDGDIAGWTQSAAGHWAASTDAPIDGEYSLHQIYNSSSSSYDAISHIFKAKLDTADIEWRFQVRYGYAPSSSNNWVFILTSDADATEMHPGGNFTGYAVGVDFSGSDDYIKLWKITSGSITEILNTNFNWQSNISTSTNVGFQISRTSAGEWTIYIDENGGFDNLKVIGSVFDKDYISSNYCGIYYKYSSSQDMKLWIDDIYISKDVTAPVLKSFDVISENKINLSFSEKIGKQSGLNLSNYTVDNSIGQPSSVIYASTDSTEISLTFSKNFSDGVNYSLSLSGIEDNAGNKLDTNVSFSWEAFKIMNVNFISRNKIDLRFNRKLEKTSAETASNYTVDNSIGNPTEAKIEQTDSTLVHLTFANTFENEKTYTIEAQNISDKYGNLLSNKDFQFVFYLPGLYDVVINELMIDVNPAPAALPANKYIEIYNRSNYDIDLSGWTMQIGTNSQKTFPTVKLKSKSYAIICSSSAESKFSKYGTTVPILTESQLTSTTGKRIIIKNSLGEVIDDITYSPTWYNDASKASGGWSLERIDPDNVCNQENNWRASTNVFGGTPDFKNSVFASNPDITAPKLLEFKTITSNEAYIKFSEKITNEQASNQVNYLLNGTTIPLKIKLAQSNKTEVWFSYTRHFNFGDNSLKLRGFDDYCGNTMKDTTIHFEYKKIHPVGVAVLSSNQLKIYFSEPVDKKSAETILNYNVDNEVGNPLIVNRDTKDTASVFLMFNSYFPKDTTLHITISGVKDENGNIMEDTQLSFVYHLLKRNDLAINEILYNPYKGGSDFVELYNKSGYPINLQKLYIAKRDDNDSIVNVYQVTTEYTLVDTGAYIVLTQDTANVASTYKHGGLFLQLKSMPSFPDDEGTVLILDDRDTIVDEFHYNDDMQLPLLSNTEGVSLERIDYNRPTQDTSNWTSAAESAGFATPGLKNSQYCDMSKIKHNIGDISLSEQVFSPDNDGYNDNLFIGYKFNKGNYVADVNIFNKNGVLVRHLVSNQTIGSQGEWKWDGLDDNDRKLNIGIYAIIVKVFDVNGKVYIFKKAAVISGKK